MRENGQNYCPLEEKTVSSPAPSAENVINNLINVINNRNNLYQSADQPKAQEDDYSQSIDSDAAPAQIANNDDEEVIIQIASLAGPT